MLEVHWTKSIHNPIAFCVRPAQGPQELSGLVRPLLAIGTVPGDGRLMSNSIAMTKNETEYIIIYMCIYIYIDVIYIYIYMLYCLYTVLFIHCAVDIRYVMIYIYI